MPFVLAHKNFYLYKCRLSSEAVDCHAYIALLKVCSMRKAFYIIPPPVLYAAFLLLAWGLSYLWPLPLTSNPWTLFFGWGAIDAGMVLMLWTAWLMLWRKTTLNPYGKPQQLITEGPFRATRNPIYVADTLLYIGIALLM